MKITMRLIIALLIAAAGVAALFSWLQAETDRELMEKELDTRANVLAEGFEEAMRSAVLAGDPDRLRSLIDRFGNRTRLIGLALFDSSGVELSSTASLQGGSPAVTALVYEAIVRDTAVSQFSMLGDRRVHLYARSIQTGTHATGTVLLAHDAAFMAERLTGIWYTNFFRLLVQIVLIILITIVVVRWSITGPIAQAAQWLRGLRAGRTAADQNLPRGDLLGPLGVEVSLLARSLAQARAAAQREARLRMTAEALWTPERLKEHVRNELKAQSLFVVSNREPFMHETVGSVTECIVPAGGLVTALDPILRACGGMWIAHGSGNADREHTGSDGTLRVPPDEPAYTLHRVFLTKEEEEGYYYGFSNEGIWPLCHITHTRPLFRKEDWQHYQLVNRKFADAVLRDIAGEEAPLVLIQDYHFALLPLLIKEQRPDARVAIFWHIPWPNPEVFGICPWKEEMLIGLLGADLIGFHTQFHCNNFLETVDRFLESKTNWEQFSVERNRDRTLVRPFPISVAFPDMPAAGDPASERKALLRVHGIDAAFLGVGVDRIDYTKGILERFLAVERFFELHPEYVGKFTFAQLGAPSRTHIKRYHDLGAELDAAVERINWRFQVRGWKAILYLKAHHNHETINRYYRAADVCLVTSLHDGMNLVAKEFVSARSDDGGVLIVSEFAGAVNELQDAIRVNPYDTEEVAGAIARALTMEEGERQLRMREMRSTVRERNVYRWAANLIT
ncbi:partial trehalose 6-phosphate synthase, partial [Anaerolineae bacterium]